MSNTDILIRIRFKFQRFCVECGKGPSFLYLGREENIEFRKWAETQWMVRDELPQSDRHVFEGMKIFEVDAKNHLEVGP